MAGEPKEPEHSTATGDGTAPTEPDRTVGDGSDQRGSGQHESDQHESDQHERGGGEPGGRESGPGGSAPGAPSAGGASVARASSRRSPSRRALLGWGGAGLAVGAAAAGGTVAAVEAGDGPEAGAGGSAVAFHGVHQAGIATPVQDRLHFAAFDLTTDDRDRVVTLLKDWTAAAARMTAGHTVGQGAYGGPAEAPPDDTGEALGLPASRLTLTVGFGPGLFEKLGLEKHRPEPLVDLPKFPGDDLEAGRSGGDLCVQACADDPQVAVHAIRNLSRIGFGTVGIRWSQLGFGKTSSTTPGAQTPRNLMGFKDGTRNIAGNDTARLDRHVWVGAKDGPHWMTGGSYLVARRIRMDVETWDRAPLQEQEDVFGRDKGRGAPVGKVHEHDAPFLPAMKPTAHVRLAHPDSNNGATLLRRGYSFTDGTDGLGRLDAGLFFLAYQRDPRSGFIPVQRRLARSDALSEYIQHVGSAVFAVPPGVRDAHDWWGSGLFGGV